MAGFPSFSRKVINRQFQEYNVPSSRYVLQKYFPMNTTDYSVDPSVLRYVEEGAPFGMTMPHALAADVQLVKMPVGKVWSDKPLHFKEGINLDEDDLLTTMRLDSMHAEREGTRLVSRANRQLSYRTDARVEWTRAQALAAGQVSLNENGVVRVLNYGLDAITPVSGAPWTNFDESDPIYDLVDLVEEYEETGAGRPDILMTRKTLNNMMKSGSIQSRIRKTNLVLRGGMKDIAPLVLELAGVEANLVVYNKGYRAENGTLTKFLPDGLLIAVASGEENLEGETFGEWASTPSLHKGGIDGPEAGKFCFPIDKTKDEENPHFKLVAGIYGAPVMFRPKWVKRKQAFAA